MFKGLKIYGNDDLLLKLKDKKPFFSCVIATTATSTIPNISGAGASAEMTEYTPAGDMELIMYGKLLCCDIPIGTASEGDFAPTPAMITKAALELTNVPFLAINAGCKVNPNTPYIHLNDISGGNISTGKAVENPGEIFKKAKIIGKELSKTSDYLVIGESVPGGTTTTLGVLTALGYDADFKVSGSSPNNRHDLKNKIVNEGIKNAKIDINGDVDAFEAIAAVGDPMMPAIAGLIFGSDVPIILAGGTQMTSVLAIVKAISDKNDDYNIDFENIAIATTKYVAEDNSANIFNITQQISEKIAIYSVNPEFEKSKEKGLNNYLRGFVKEGAGAGGAMLMAMILGYSIDEIRLKIEEYL
ncbi:MAG: TIGR00303 family protein [Methanobrevibacter sp.]|jgi:uncharacterized protein (TIGR00303 family)|nr:TIGR00303 family protein [Candidatus Methanoflexus mossambicus]